MAIRSPTLQLQLAFLNRSCLPCRVNRLKEAPLSSHPSGISFSRQYRASHQQNLSFQKLSASFLHGPLLSKSESKSELGSELESDPVCRESSDPSQCVSDPSRWAAVYDKDRRPLCEHAPAALVPLDEVLTWQAEQQRRIDGEIGDRLEQSDGGPSRKELRRELEWMLEDATAGWVEGGITREENVDTSRVKGLVVQGTGQGEGEGEGMEEGVEGKRVGLREEGEGLGEKEWLRRLKRLNWRDVQLMGNGVHGGNSSRSNSQFTPPGTSITSTTSTNTSSASTTSITSTTSTTNTSSASSTSSHPSSASPLIALRLPFPSLRLLWRARLSLRVPSQYLVGGAHWRDLLLAVQPGVLIPRPETELLVDLAVVGMEKAEEMERGGREREGLGEREGLAGKEIWADLGTGSGAIAVDLARELLKRREKRGWDGVKQQCGEGRGERSGDGERRGDGEGGGVREGGGLGEEVVVVAVDASAVACEVAALNSARYGLQVRLLPKTRNLKPYSLNPEC
ncbi:unnamed protein product [Closterium sp. NIES-53]